jgi:hypothetical protein
MPRISTIDRAIPGTLAPPATWTALHVRNRLIEACQIEKRMPRDGHRQTGSWVPVLHEFADVVGWADARDRVWARWERACGAMPHEITRMEEAFTWLRELAHAFPGEARCLSTWAVAQAHGASLQRLLRHRRWSSSTFHRKLATGSERIAKGLNRMGAPVR